jgi:glycosyltransferase involved in cell wall biosynthesis
MNMGYIIGIDASNLTRGGGRTYLIDLLKFFSPSDINIQKVVVWGSLDTLKLLPDENWIKKISPHELNKGILQRIYWQKNKLSIQAYDEKIDILFIPGGSYLGNFRPYVTMNHNLLPFDWNELKRYFLTFDFIRLLTLRYVQSCTIKNSSGTIFLSEYSKKKVLNIVGKITSKTVIIPHGVNNRFKYDKKLQKPITEYTESDPYVLLYVSTIDLYKHQWNVVEAVYALRTQHGWPLHLHLIGSANKFALRKLNQSINKYDKKREWIKYFGEIPYESINIQYANADMSVFASSIENFPFILIESISAGLPIVCSNNNPMPIYLKSRAEYFDPLSANSIADALKVLILSQEKRQNQISQSDHNLSTISWESCANKTFSFLTQIVNS